jgi:hypothetical protein
MLVSGWLISKNILLLNCLAYWTETWREAPMEGSVLSFLKAEWKVSDTGSSHWASSCYHHQKVIDHVHANHPFCCYYCNTTCTEFDNIIKHSVKNHSLDVLKIKHLELNEKNGIYGYRSHNFNIIPRDLDSTGKKIETDTTLDS